MDMLSAVSYRVYSVLGGAQCSRAVYCAIDWIVGTDGWYCDEKGEARRRRVPC
ncbi:uncharacterized protein G2W53_035512 [Senna tora]|uniref:Uncharacterized protein n=1 Tax=Senna tora TaxID=362788 RepID=A0A834T3P3_9FABA|nr:uncharacterized protein G2W53_035512 [Senna tora]